MHLFRKCFGITNSSRGQAMRQRRTSYARGGQVTSEAHKFRPDSVGTNKLRQRRTGSTTAEGNHTMLLVRRSARGGQVTPEAHKSNNGKGAQVTPEMHRTNNGRETSKLVNLVRNLSGSPPKSGILSTEINGILYSEISGILWGEISIIQCCWSGDQQRQKGAQAQSPDFASQKGLFILR